MSVPMSLDEDVPMSLDDDADMKKVERRIRKEKEMSLDDDDYANLEKLKRKKILYIVDVDAVRLGRMTQIDNFPPDGVRVKIENLRKISDDDLKLPSSLCLWQLERYLTAMAETFLSKDWSLLQKYCFRTDSSSTENLSFEEALKHELVATCFLFLLTKECPPHVKECLVSALQFILSMSPKATNMPIDQEEGVDHAPRKMSIDQAGLCCVAQSYTVSLLLACEVLMMIVSFWWLFFPVQKASIEALMVDALRSGNKEIIRQACTICTIVYVGVLDLIDTVGTGIHSELVKVACSFPLSCDTRGATYVLRAIKLINYNFEGGEMREKLVEAVLSDTEWLLSMMRDHDIDLVQEAYGILVFLTQRGYDAGIWETLEDDFIPQILKSCREIYGIGRTGAAKVFANTINGASPEQIGQLVYGLDLFLPALLSFLDTNEYIRSFCMVAIENILKADEEESCYNIYALKIGEHFEKIGSIYGWGLLDNEAPNSEDILVKYAPDDWLIGRYDLWCRREEMLQQYRE